MIHSKKYQRQTDSHTAFVSHAALRRNDVDLKKKSLPPVLCVSFKKTGDLGSGRPAGPAGPPESPQLGGQAGTQGLSGPVPTSTRVFL